MCLRFADRIGQDESARSWLPRVGAKGPPVAFGIAHGEVTRSVVGVVQVEHDVRTRGSGSSTHSIWIIGHHVGAETARRERPVILGSWLVDRAKHDSTTQRPGQLGVIDPVTIAIHHRLFEPEGVDQKADQCPSVACAERRPNLGRGRCGDHEVVYQERNVWDGRERACGCSLPVSEKRERSRCLSPTCTCGIASGAGLMLRPGPAEMHQ